MHDLLLSTTYLLSGGCILIATIAQERRKTELNGSRRLLETGAHVFSCISLSVAYAVHAFG
jgi:hypothetical protein